MEQGTKRLHRTVPLHTRLVEELIAEVQAGTWKVNDRLPTESELARTYGVSRSTIREALRILRHEGLVCTIHGQGTFVSRSSQWIHAGIETLKSITTTIEEQGRRPGMHFRSVVTRDPSEKELEILEQSGHAAVVEVQRSLLADDTVVAYSYDLIPTDILPQDFSPGEIKGSLFAYLESRCGVYATRSIAKVHAVHDSTIAWEEDGDDTNLYVLLDQVHYDAEDRVVLYTRMYFIEGRFNFFVVRTR